ncbi:hypothetical protein L916_02761 [Phytophthora nicotianae]|uniref:Uncharacterized protein n=1 Tax=Phytophthora nicotianae TaxID=4792 RepID=W2JPE2_PHYNI|nr:hypothetical protein L916_02761 [Phytophthora nicotianae]
MPYSTELQRRKRAKLREPRVQAKVLQAQLAELPIIRQQLDVGLLHKRKPRSEIPLFQHNFCEEITEELANEVNNLYHETSAVLPAVDTSTLVAYRCQSFPLLSCAEITASTPVGLSVQETEELLWKSVHHYDSQECCQRRRIQRKIRLCVGAARWFFASVGLVLQDFNWTVISPSPTNPKYGSVIREFYKLEATAVTQAKTQVQKTILDLVGNRMRIITQSMQETP